jgi:predicted membrane-bound spermidine synthase
MIKDLINELEIKVLSALLTAVAAAITLVSMAFAVYAGFKLLVVAPAAAALTALVFAVITGLIGLLAPRLSRKTKRRQEDLQPKVSPMVSAVEIGAVAAAIGREWIRRRSWKRHA